MRPMHQIMKHVHVAPVVKNYIPCSLDCQCVRTLNLKDSYTDRFLYKKCYERYKMFTNTSTNDFLKRLILKKN